jgi:SAM-dependent methyltransferase
MRGALERMDEQPDEAFYTYPRMVYHIDEEAVEAVTQLYREYFRPGGDTLDLMSSWVSHLPEEVTYGRVVGLGMNAGELQANPRLSAYYVQNLNEEPNLPFEDDSFDQAAICVSVDYLVRPLAVFYELRRVLRPGGPLVITFSNRCFPSKVIGAWLRLNETQRMLWVKGYFAETGGWENVHALDRSPCRGGDPLYAVIGYAGKVQREEADA